MYYYIMVLSQLSKIGKPDIFYQLISFLQTQYKYCVYANHLVFTDEKGRDWVVRTIQ